MLLLSTTYLGPIQYFGKLKRPDVRIEAWENFQKQTYRNRAHIMTAGGVKALTVPIVRNHGEKMPVQNVKIDYTLPWQREHWRTLAAAYKAAPYFDHYAEKLAPYFDYKRYCPEFLFDLNTELTAMLSVWSGLSGELKFTEDYISPKTAIAKGIKDFRDVISHKPRLRQEDPEFTAPHYYQVFEDRIPFEPNLSVIDLLFCEGPAAKDML